MNKTRGIAIAGVFGALQLVFIIIGYYTQFFNLGFNLLASAALMIVIIVGRPQAFLCFIAVSLLALAFTFPFGCIPYVIFFGSWTLISILMMEKGLKWYITLPIKAAWAALVFFIGYSVVQFLVFDFTAIGIPPFPVWSLYIFFTLFTLFFDYAVLLNVYKFILRRFGFLINRQPPPSPPSE